MGRKKKLKNNINVKQLIVTLITFAMILIFTCLMEKIDNNYNKWY